MAAFADDSVIDAGLTFLRDNVTHIVLLVNAPTDFADADTLKSGGGEKVAEKAIGAGNFTGPADGDTDGRKITLNAISDVSIDETATGAGTNWQHIALIDRTNSVLRYWVSLATPLDVEAGETRDTKAMPIEIGDPAVV